MPERSVPLTDTPETRYGGRNGMTYKLYTRSDGWYAVVYGESGISIAATMVPAQTAGEAYMAIAKYLEGDE